MSPGQNKNMASWGELKKKKPGIDRTKSECQQMRQGTVGTLTLLRSEPERNFLGFFCIF
jgi:hypothetical protein